MSENYASGVSWDLSDLYVSLRDPRLEADLKKARELAAAFEKKYKPLFEKMGSDGAPFPLADLLRDYKAVVTLMTKPGVFTHLSFAERTNDPAVAAFMQKTQVTLTDIGSHTRSANPRKRSFRSKPTRAGTRSRVCSTKS
jgi:oligoendopeptidase F